MKKTAENKESIKPSDLNSIDLIVYHRQLHIMWRALLQGEDIGVSTDEVFNHHEIAAKEMTKRKIQIDEDGNHTSPLPETLEKNNESTSLKYLRHYSGHLPKKKKKPELSSLQIADIKTLIKGSQSLSDVARLVGCSKSSVIYHSKK